MAGGRFKELFKKYGKVALGVHFSVSAASITGLYVAVKNNVDVESMLEKVGMTSFSKGKESEETNAAPHPKPDSPDSITTNASDVFIKEETEIRRDQAEVKQRNRTAELAASSGGALALALLLNKALFPIRVPITIALTPPVARFLARRQIFRNS